MPRVLHLYEGFFAGGARILHTDVVRGLQRAGYENHVISLTKSVQREGTTQRAVDDPRYRALVEDGVFVETLGGSSLSELPRRGAAHVHAAVTEADIVLSLKEQPLVAVASHITTPLLACLHRSDPEHSGVLGTLLRAPLSGAISCADSTRAAYEAAGLSTQHHLVRNGIDLSRFTPAGRPDAPVILFAARFDAMKNPALFLAAVREHMKLRTDATYVMCGAGMTFANPSFAELAGDTPVQALGTRNDMPDLYRGASVVALTSAFGEAAPLCLMEGAACGAVPVTTDVGDAAAIATALGGIVTPRDARSIAFAWEEALKRRPTNVSQFSRERMVAEYASVIESYL